MAQGTHSFEHRGWLEVTFEADEDCQPIALNVKTGAVHAAVVTAPIRRQ